MKLNAFSALALLLAAAQGANAISVAAPATEQPAGITSNAPAGYLLRAEAMANDLNPRGVIDQLSAIAHSLPSADMEEKAALLQALSLMQLPDIPVARTLLKEYLLRFPCSIYRQDVMLALAHLSFCEGNYATALRAYRLIAPEALTASQAGSLTYHQGYCELLTGHISQARNAFTTLMTSGEYANSARFFLAYIDYLEGHNAQALQQFQRVIPQGAPTQAAPYYIAQLLLASGNAAQALSTAAPLTEPTGDLPVEFTAEALRVAGEANYLLDNQKDGIKLLQRYYPLVSNPRPSASYLLGVEDYRNGAFEAAVEKLNDVSRLDSELGQSAALYAGLAYTELGNLNAATMAFETASRSDFDPTLQELGLYNLAVTSADGGKKPFASTASLFEEFLHRFPDSRYAPEAANYLVSGYVADNNHLQALRALEAVRHPSPELLRAKQKVLYSLGTRRLQAGDASQAAGYLRQAAELSSADPSLASEATLWLGQALYHTGDLTESATYLRKYLNRAQGTPANRALAHFYLGYTLFASKDHKAAAAQFQRFTEDAPAGISDNIKADALNRLGDSQYYMRQFAKAEQSYSRAAATDPSAADYPIFQQAMMQGLQRNHSGKIAILRSLLDSHPSSPLLPRTMLELAESLNETSQTAEAIETYTALARQYPHTEQGRQGLLLLAITHLNNGNRPQAVETYKEVITRYPTSEQARVAADDLKQLYADSGRLTDYLKFINSVDQAPKPETAELAALQLTSVEKAREAGRNPQALTLARELLEKYPDAPQAIEALAIAAQIEYEQGETPQALDDFTILEQKASSAEQIAAARIGIMRSAHDLGMTERTIDTADAILATATTSAAQRREATYLKALALSNTDRQAQAIELLTTLTDEIDDIYGTKSAFHIAEIHYSQKQYDAAQKAVNRIIDANPPHDYWLGRSFILLSDILRAQGNTFEADEYLRSLRDNYPGSEVDIFRMIDQRLK